MKDTNTQPTAAVYDRWLASLGGGEQVAFAYAQALRKLGYRVSMITHQRVDLEKAQRKMGVDLNQIDVVYIPEQSSQAMSGVSEKYDVFINTSHLDYFANRAKIGILSVFFPALIRLSLYEYLKRAFFVPSFRRLFIYPSHYEGFSHDEYLQGRIYKWLSQESSIVFNHPVSRFSIMLHLDNFTSAVVDTIAFSLDKQPVSYVKRKVSHTQNTVEYSFDFGRTTLKHFTISLPDHPYANRVALLSLTIPGARYTLYNIFKKFAPKWEMRLHGGPGVTKLSDLESYHSIVTISQFCKKWIRAYWGLNSSVLYPPVNTNEFAPAEKKKNYILHVGRFFTTGHSKKQLEMVKLFKKLYDQHNVKDWELHLVGSIHPGRLHQRYFDTCVTEAEGYPIYFHTKLDFKELQTLYSQSKIYWHATGLDQNEEREPVVFEHFGITTIEAMASGCVPIVINAGGQKEIVTPDSGMTWQSRNEWMNQTKEVIEDQKLMKKLSKGAIARSKDFSREVFFDSFKKLLSELA